MAHLKFLLLGSVLGAGVLIGIYFIFINPSYNEAEMKRNAILEAQRVVKEQPDFLLWEDDIEYTFPPLAKT